MSYECFDLTVTNRIAHIRLNRPEKANSMIPSFWTELPSAVNAVSREASARVLVISAEGKHFCAGMDISVFTDGGLDGPEGTNSHIGAEAFRHHAWHFRTPSLVSSKHACRFWWLSRVLRWGAPWTSSPPVTVVTPPETLSSLSTKPPLG